MWVFLELTGHTNLQDEVDRVITLNKVIETGKTSNVETDRHMHLSWEEFRRVKSDYESLFDELICTEPDRLRRMRKELDRLSKEVKIFSKFVIQSNTT